MRLLDILRLRFRSMFWRRRVEEDLDEELQYHLDRQIDEYAAAGMSREKARNLALREMAGLTQRKEECRDMRGFQFLDHLRRDFRYSLRQLRKNRAFAFTAIFVLALGVCASLSIFAFVDAALIQPLPYRDPARLLSVVESPAMSVSYANFLDWKERNTVFQSFAAYRSRTANLATPDGPQPFRGALVTGEFMRTLGVTPILGRDFSAADNLPSAPHTLLLSYASWQKRYAGRRDALGQVLDINSNQYTVIGVLPREFHFAPVGQAEFWMAYQPVDYESDRRSRDLFGVGRLRDGVPAAAAQSNFSAIAAQLQREYPIANQGEGVAVVPLTETIVGNIRPVLLVLFAGAGLLLVIASVNVAGLQLVRSESREREIAARAALGASASRLIGQFATEAVVVTFAGTGIGAISAHWAIALLARLISPSLLAYLPFLAGIGVNGHALAAAGAVTLASAALLTLPSAARIWRANTRAGLAEASRGSSGRGWRRFGSRLVILELATAMVLLAGAGLLGKSLYRMMRVSLGVDPGHLFTTDIWLPGSYEIGGRTVTVTRGLERVIEEVPGVRSAGYEDGGLPLGANGGRTPFHVSGRPWNGTPDEEAARHISPAYFPTLGAKLLAGRYFRDTEDDSKPRVAIVNQSFARKYFPKGAPIGKALAAFPDNTPIEIVGVVEDVREGPLDEPIPPVIYMPFAQGPSPYFSIVVRTWQDERAVMPAVWAAIRRADRDIVPVRGAPMADRINDSESAYLHRSLAWVVGGFAVLALLLGVVGLYGVIAYSVSRRSREIGIRMALGAQTGSVYRLILREAAKLTILGTTIGLAGAIAAATLMRNLLFGVRAWDLATLAGVAAVLSTAALAASFLPARRAAAVDPVEALRAD